MFKRLILTAVALAVVFTASMAVADWVPACGHKMHFPQFPDVTGWDVNATNPTILADDWICSETGWVRDIHFWGSWMHGMEGEIASFVLSIHADIPANPPEIPYSRPGETLWEEVITDFVIAVPVDPPGSEGWYDPATGVFFPDDHTEYYQYNVFLDEPRWFWQEEGTIYWLSISAIVVDPVNTQWGWKSTLDHWNDDAVWAFWGELDWVDMWEPPDFIESLDLAFVIADSDTCAGQLPGDVNCDGNIDALDIAAIIGYLYHGGNPPCIIPNGDVDGDCCINDLDYIYLMYYKYQGGPPPVECTCLEPDLCQPPPPDHVPGLSKHNLDDYELSDGDPAGTIWEELWPNFPDFYTAGYWGDNGNEALDIGDTMAFYGPSITNELINLITPTIVAVDDNDDTIFIDMINPQNEQITTGLIPDALGTYWLEVFPNYGIKYYMISDIFDIGINGNFDLRALNGPNSGMKLDNFEAVSIDIDIVSEVLPQGPCFPGEVNQTPPIDLLDILYLIQYKYKDGPPPQPYDTCSGDANCDCIVDLLDILHLIQYKYKDGPPPCSCTDWLNACGSPIRKE